MSYIFTISDRFTEVGHKINPTFQRYTDKDDILEQVRANFFPNMPKLSFCTSLFSTEEAAEEYARKIYKKEIGVNFNKRKIFYIYEVSCDSNWWLEPRSKEILDCINELSNEDTDKIKDFAIEFWNTLTNRIDEKTIVGFTSDSITVIKRRCCSLESDDKTINLPDIERKH